MIIELDSVGCVIDDMTFIVYPKYINGGYDEDGGISLDECSSEWYKALDSDDKFLIGHLLDIKKSRRIYY